MLPYEEYLAELRKFPTVFRAGIDMTYIDDVLHVYAKKRDAGDEYYGSQWVPFGSTVLMRENVADFWARHRETETGLEESEHVPAWSFCGIVHTPNTIRQHGVVEVFGRVWGRFPRMKHGEWVSVSKMNSMDFVPSTRIFYKMAVDVLVEKETPYFTEFSGTDEKSV